MRAFNKNSPGCSDLSSVALAKEETQTRGCGFLQNTSTLTGSNIQIRAATAMERAKRTTIQGREDTSNSYFVFSLAFFETARFFPHKTLYNWFHRRSALEDRRNIHEMTSVT